jgi:hypothetical protein
LHPQRQPKSHNLTRKTVAEKPEQQQDCQPADRAAQIVTPPSLAAAIPRINEVVELYKGTIYANGRPVLKQDMRSSPGTLT